jgi:exonuclease III
MSKLRVVSWNCGGYRYNGFNCEKANKLLKLVGEPDPDVLVIQEITIEECLAVKSHWKHAVWYNDGVDDSYRGVAVLSQKYEIGFAEKFNRNFRYVLPYEIGGHNGHNPDFELFAVWTKKEPLEYDKNLFEALKYYKSFDSNTVVIGDYNVGACDGYPNRFKELKENMTCAGLKNCAKDKELTKPTSVWNKDAYQNDYCFASDDLADNAKLKVLDNDKEHKLSDHYPIVVDFS